MRVPLSWLKDFIPLETDPRDRVAVADLGRVLDSLGLVVEGIDYVGSGLEDVVLARVLEIHAIEGADRIRRVLVDAGAGKRLEIVCGAMNFVVGDIVPLAPVGATLPDGMAITQRKMRGITSNGMLCSGRELGLDEDGAGLLVLASTATPDAPLPAGIELGMALTSYLGVTPDAVFDLAIEPNRPDALSVIGIARDLGARLGLAFNVPVPVLNETGPPIATIASIAVDAPSACRRLIARALTGVAAVPSSPEVTRRLTLAGMRPINAIVDASNYVMFEFGQPTHPYDLDRLGAPGITVRLAQPGETLVTLDGVERRLGLLTEPNGEDVLVEDCVIADSAGTAVGIAGVMGGETSEISPQTTRVLLEVADFDPLTIGRTAARQAVRTEASARFWRGIDPEGLSRAADRFCELVIEAMRLAGKGSPDVATGLLDEHPVGREQVKIALSLERVNAVLGTDLSIETIAALLKPIGFASAGNGAELTVSVPSFRPDISLDVDLIEEVARHLGYEQITATERRSPYVGRLSEYQRSRRKVRALLSGLSAHEAWTSSIVNPEVAARAGASVPAIEVTNPIVREESVLRTHLLPGLLGALSYNAAHRNGSLRLFEIGRVFAPPPPGGERPVEREQLAVALGFDDDDAKSATAIWRSLLEGLAIEPSAVALVQRQAMAHDAEASPLGLGAHPSRTALVVAHSTGAALGVVGEVDPGVLANFGLGGRRVGWIVFDMESLLALERRSPLAKAVSRFPSSDIDLAFSLDEQVAAGELESVLRESAGELCESLSLIDVYRGAGLDENTRSLAYRLRFCAPDHTLTDGEVAALRARCINEVEAGLPARLRG